MGGKRRKFGLSMTPVRREEFLAPKASLSGCPSRFNKRKNTISFHYTGVKVLGVDIEVGPFVFSPARPPVTWGCSSAGRAPPLHGGSRGFESPQLHHIHSPNPLPVASSYPIIALYWWYKSVVGGSKGGSKWAISPHHGLVVTWEVTTSCRHLGLRFRLDRVTLVRPHRRRRPHLRKVLRVAFTCRPRGDK